MIASHGPDDLEPLLPSASEWAALTFEESGPSLPSGVPGHCPIVGAIDLDLLRDGEAVRVEGRAGTVEIPGVSETNVVTSFLESDDGRLLLLRRSPRVGSFPGRWAGVSGYIEDEEPESAARREILEETGVGSERLVLLASGRPVYARDGARVFRVHPFRYRVAGRKITIDWEHTEHEWVDPSEIDRRETVQKLPRVYRATWSGDLRRNR